MVEVIWIFLTTICGAVVGYLCHHVWIGTVIGFALGVACALGDPDILENIADCFD